MTARTVLSADDHLSVHHAFQTVAGGHVRDPQMSDPALQFDALRRLVVAALRHGRAPLWNPDIYGGAPLLADGQSMVGSPVTWMRLLFREDLAQDMGVAWVLAWAGLGTALLAGALGGDALVAALAAMTGPFLVSWLLYPHAAVFCWLPWVLWGLERRRPVWTALAVAGLIGGGHPGTVAFSLLIAAAWWAVRVRAWRPALGVLVGGLLAAPLWLPLLEQALRSTTLAARGGLTLAPSALWDLLWPGALGSPAAETWRGVGAWADGQLHPGLGVLALALVGWRRAWGLWLAWAGLVLLAIIGIPGPFPAARLGGMAALFLALAAGLGAARLGRRARLVAAALVLATGLQARWGAQGLLTPAQHDPVPAPWTAALRQAVGDGRVLGLGWALQPNTGSLVGVRDLRGYDLPVSVDTQRLMAALSPHPRGPWYPVERVPPLPLLRLLGVRVLLSTQPIPDLPTLDLGGPLFAARVPGEVPRAWLSPGALPAPDPDTALQRALVAADPRVWPPVEGLAEPVTVQAPIVPLDITEPRPEEVRLALPGTPGLAVLADAWAPGWTATVDGRPAPVLRVAGLIRGVLVHEPDRVLIFRYRPRGWTWGLRLAALGLLGLGLLWYRRCPR